jgi:hypothetical protein
LEVETEETEMMETVTAVMVEMVAMTETVTAATVSEGTAKMAVMMETAAAVYWC